MSSSVLRHPPEAAVEEPIAGIEQAAPRPVHQANTSGATRFIPPLITSAVAIAIACTAIAIAGSRQRFGKGIEAYDFSSAEAALLSTAQIMGEGQLQAGFEMIEVMEDRGNPNLSTVQVHKSVDWKGGKLLFVSYEANGGTQYETPLYTKDAETGFWHETQMGIGGAGFRSIANELNGIKTEADRIHDMADKWCRQGVLE